MSVAIHAARRVPSIDWTGVPANLKGKASAVCRTAQECEELVRWFGDPDFCPLLGVMVMVPGANAPVMIEGLGYATAAELRDCAVVTWHDLSNRIATSGNIMDFDAARERRGLMRREDVDGAVREALQRRVAQHKANPVTDPPRQPDYPNPGNKTLFSVGG